MAPYRQCRQLSQDWRQRESYSKLLPEVLLVGEVADLVDQDADDLEAREGLGSVTKELIEELEHRLQADDGPFEVGALLGLPRALA